MFEITLIFVINWYVKFDPAGNKTAVGMQRTTVSSFHDLIARLVDTPRYSRFSRLLVYYRCLFENSLNNV